MRNEKRTTSGLFKTISLDIMVILQPCDWQESTANYKYVVDVFGRTPNDDVVKVRLTGFCPYFYIKYEGSTSQQLQKRLESQATENNKRYGGKLVNFFGMKITVEEKLDAMNKFSGLVPIKVWKITCPSLWMFKNAAKAAEKLGLITYETDLPPYIRLFHELDIYPASPISFEADPENVPEGVNVDLCYTVHYKNIQSCPNEKVALYLAAYDIEVYSDSGNFPVSSNEKDEIIQIGVSFRYSDDMLNSYKRVVLVNGTVEKSLDPTIEFIPCSSEKDLLLRFEKLIRDENPDAICGYNTFGFDDGYIADRAFLPNRIPLKFGRIGIDDYYDERKDYVETEKKTFELASGKFAVRYFRMPGRLPIDLLLSVRREQNLDSDRKSVV